MTYTILRIVFICAALLLLLAFRSNRPAVSAAEEQALLITIPLRDSPDIAKLQLLEDRLGEAIEKSHAGELDGNEIGEGTYTIYIYGPDAKRLFKTVQPILKDFRPPMGSYVIIRYGKPGARQEKISLDAEKKAQLTD